MKKAILGLAAVGAFVGLARAKRKMQEHFAEMAVQCKQMAGQFGTRGEPVGKT